MERKFWEILEKAQLGHLVDVDHELAGGPPRSSQLQIRPRWPLTFNHPCMSRYRISKRRSLLLEGNQIDMPR